MSDSERRKNIFKYVFAVLAVVILLVFAFGREDGDEQTEIINEEMLFPFSDFSINYSNGSEISFSGTLTKEEFRELLNEKGISLPKMAYLLPEKVDISCTAHVNITEDSKVLKLRILSAKVNGFEIPQKVLSDIGEINLDFKRSLVYNK